MFGGDCVKGVAVDSDVADGGGKEAEEEGSEGGFAARV